MRAAAFGAARRARLKQCFSSAACSPSVAASQSPPPLRWAVPKSGRMPLAARAAGPLLVLSASVALAASSPSAACSPPEGSAAAAGRSRSLRAPPPRFGRRLPSPPAGAAGAWARAGAGARGFSSGGTDGGGTDGGDDGDEDCPVCRKYSRGPCGPLFRRWRACADAHPGRDAGGSGEEAHLSACADLAGPLADCLSEHAEFYAGPIDYDLDGGGRTGGGDGREASQAQLAEAWSEVVAELEAEMEAGTGTGTGTGTIPRRRERRRRAQVPFPPTRHPEMEVRPESGWGVVSFAPTDDRGEPLVLAYLSDQNGRLLAAGSGADLEEAGGFLRFALDGKGGTECVLASALYGGAEGDPVCVRAARLPPGPKPGPGPGPWGSR